MLRDVQTARIALAQIAPRLGALEENLARHSPVARASARGWCRPRRLPRALGLTGYQLQDLAAEVAMRLDDPRLAERGRHDRRPLGRRVVRRGISRPPALHRGGVARGRGDPARPPQELPADVGLFDERRFFAPGDLLRAVPSRLGPGIGMAICEDFWHLAVAQLLALDGAQIRINVSSSPGREYAATNEVGLGTATSWRTLMRTYAQLTTSFVVFCNRVGVDESISFWGGSEVIGPTGGAIFSAPFFDEGLYTVEVNLSDIRRERVALPLLRDERPELRFGKLSGSSPSGPVWPLISTAEYGSEAGSDIAPAVPVGDHRVSAA